MLEQVVTHRIDDLEISNRQTFDGESVLHRIDDLENAF